MLVFLDKANLARLDLEKVAWRARKSAEFFRKLTALLAQHHIWSEPVWRYAVQHNDATALREWLRHQDEFLAHCGPWLDAKLVAIDPIERRSYEHLEYSPLVNQRAHCIGAENKIRTLSSAGNTSTCSASLRTSPRLMPSISSASSITSSCKIASKKPSRASPRSKPTPCRPACNSITSAPTPRSTKSKPSKRAPSPPLTPIIPSIAGASSSPR